MMAWAMEHPWMTFFLAAWGISVIGDTICTIAKEAGKRRSERDEQLRLPQNDEE